MVYTGGDDFDWDDANVDHIARHSVQPLEAEDAIADPEAFTFRGRSPGERRYVVVGRTAAGRLLTVIFTRRARLVRVVTARDASSAETRRYRRN